MPPEFQWVERAGALGVFVLLITALKAGWLGTRQEIDAWKLRTERAEKQVDTLLPAIEKLTAAVLDRAAAAKGAP